MGRASIDQTSFTGGEWGPLAYGRSDDARYTTAMALCLNGYACEEGSWLKRTGTELIVPTYQSAYANILAFDGSDTCSFAMEFTDPVGAETGFLRLLTQSSLVFTNDAQTITSVDTVNGVITLSGDPSWANNDEVMLVFPDVSSPYYPYAMSDEVGLRNQVLTIGDFSSATNATLKLAANYSGIGPIVSFAASTNLVGAQMIRVLRFTTPYTNGIPQIQALRAVQAEINNFVLSNQAPIQQLQVTSQGTLTSDPVFSFGPVTLIDGPYLDPQNDTLTLSGTSGSITLTSGSNDFAATDVGRAVRIFTQPPIYNPASSYTTGENVTDSNGAWWTALQAVSPGQAPGQAATVGGVATVVWAPNPTAGSWAWGLITAYTSATEVSFTFDTTIPNMSLQASNGDTAYTWQLGVYSATTGYPANGVFYEGRLWLGGCVLNRFDTSTSNGVSQIIGTNTITFSPTDPYGNVVDDSGISEVLNSKGINQIQWMIGDQQGVLMGTLSGEVLVSASALGDPITPTSIQAHEITRYGSENIEVTRAGMALIFAQKFGRRIMEYLDDAFSQKFSGRHLNEFSKHITAAGVSRLEYQEEPIPIVWALMNNGLLAGSTYRRFSRFISQPPEMSSWHWHMHGGNKVFTSMCVVPGKLGLLDRLFLVTNDPPASPTQVVTNYAIEIMQPPYDPSQSIYEGWFVDESSGPGPGNSGFDCGGGNPSSFAVTGSYRGADTTTPVAPPLLQQLQDAPLGQSPPAGGVLMLKHASYFPGSVILYNIPRYGSPTDEAAMSASFWVGSNDLLATQGALIGTPALTPAEVGTGSQAVSALNPTFASMFDGIGDGYRGATADGNFSPPTQQWAHVMWSVESLGNGSIKATWVINDTVILNQVTFSGVADNGNDMWQFSTQKDRQEDFGPSLWSVGGQLVVPPDYTVTVTTNPGPVQTFKVPGLASLLAPGTQNFVLARGSGNQLLFTPAPTPQAIYDLLYVGHSYTVNTTLSSVTFSGGQSNFPYPSDGEGSVSGYVGSVAELWVKPGSFIDWTQSANRYKFHEYDSVSNTYGPVALGLTGTKPGFGTPWIYLTGPPKLFPLNNVNGKYLTETDTTSSIIDFDSGLGGGLQNSPLSFP